VLGPGAPEDRFPGILGALSPTWDWVDLRTYTPWSWLSPRRAERLDDGFVKILAALYDIPAEFMPLLRREERRRRGHLLRLALGLMLGVSLALGGLAWLAMQQRDLARRETQRAMMQLLAGSVKNLGRYAASWIAWWPKRPSSTAALT